MVFYWAICCVTPTHSCVVSRSPNADFFFKKMNFELFFSKATEKENEIWAHFSEFFFDAHFFWGKINLLFFEKAMNFDLFVTRLESIILRVTFSIKVIDYRFRFLQFLFFVSARTIKRHYHHHQSCRHSGNATPLAHVAWGLLSGRSARRRQQQCHAVRQVRIPVASTQKLFQGHRVPAQDLAIAKEVGGRAGAMRAGRMRTSATE